MPTDQEKGAPGGAIDAGLAALAKSIDAEGGAAGPGAASNDPAAPAAPTDYQAEARELIDFLTATLVPLYPSLAAIYTTEVKGSVAIGVAPLLKKYDFDLAKLFGKYGPEIGAAMVLVPLVAPTLQAVAADRQAHKEARAAAAAKAKQAAAPAAAAGADASSAPAGGIPDPNKLADKA